jgi:hypothetical protein
VGIGTVSPGYKLDVSSSGGVAAVLDIARLYANASANAEVRLILGTFANATNSAIGAQSDSATTGILKFYTATAGSLSEKMRLDASGIMGLGVTPSAWGGPQKAIEFAGASSVSYNNTAPQIYLNTNAYYNGTNWIYKTTAAAAQISSNPAGSSPFQVSIAASGTAGNPITFTPAMTLDASARLFVGNTTTSLTTTGGLTPSIQSIGTTNSTSSIGSFKFSTDSAGSYISFTKTRAAAIGTFGTAVVAGDTLGTLLWTADGGTTTAIQAAGIESFVDNVSGIVSTTSMPSSLRFLTTANNATTPTTRMTISSLGNVGIGVNPTTLIRLNLDSVGSDITNVEYGSNFALTANNISGTVGKYATRSFIQTGSGFAGTGVSGAYLAAASATVAVTGSIQGVRTSFTNSGAGAVAAMYGYVSTNPSNSGGGSITNYYGFAQDDVTTAGSAYSILGSMNSSGSSKWNLFMSGTAPNYMLGQLGVGTTAIGNAYVEVSPTQSVTPDQLRFAGSNTYASPNIFGLRVNPTLTGTSAINAIYGLLNAPVFNAASGATANDYYGFDNQPSWSGTATPGTIHLNRSFLSIGASTAGTTSSVYVYQAINNSAAVGSTAKVDTIYGFHAANFGVSQSVYITNAYGFYGNQAKTGANTTNYNLYMAGSAPNYMAANLAIGTANSTTRLLGIEATQTASVKIKNTTNAAPTYEAIGIYNDTETGYLKLNVNHSGAAGASGYVQINSANTISFQMGGADKIFVTQTGGLALNTTADPGIGSIYNTGVVVSGYSDDNLKTKLGNIDNALDKLMTLNGFYYEPNQTALDLGYKPKKEVGVSAQEVQKVLPEVVVSAPIGNDYLTVQYDRLIPLMIEAIKELKTEVELLKSQIK